MTASAELSRIHAALRELDADLCDHVHGDVVLIGSAAARLAGAAVEVADLDLLTDVDDAQALEQVWARQRVAYQPADGERFRSRFARYEFASMTVEVMGGLEVCVDGVWQTLRIEQATALPGYAAPLRVPVLAEQLRVLALFGRAKDHLRMQSLQALRAKGAAT